MTAAPGTDDRPLTVGALARLAGVSVRTLHHYDEIGLLSPAARTVGGYREYTAAHARRLQRILFYRELELPLDRIQQLIDDPGVDELDHLRRQHDQLGERISRLQRVRDAVQTTMEAHEMGMHLTPAERLEVFGDHDPAQYATEARERWGHTDAYAQHNGKIAQYSKEDWLRIKARGEAIEAELAAAMVAGEPANGAVAVEIAERYRLHMAESFYDVTPEMHRTLGDLWTSDARFTAHYEAIATGLAIYARDAVNANADQHAAD